MNDETLCVKCGVTYHQHKVHALCHECEQECLKYHRDQFMRAATEFAIDLRKTCGARPPEADAKQWASSIVGGAVDMAADIICSAAHRIGWRCS